MRGSFCPASPNDSYDPAHFAPLFAIEDEHFWFRSRNRVLASILGPIEEQLGSGYRVLEVGCGTGNTLQVMENVFHRGSVIGLDLYSQGLRYARLRTKCHLVQGDLMFPPFFPDFQLVGAFDVLEHMADDLSVLNRVKELLSPGGALVLTVPAHPGLWSYFDELSHHHRRYSVAQLNRKLDECGYHVDLIRPFNACLFPLMWLRRRLLRRSAGAAALSSAHDLLKQELAVNPILNRLLTVILEAEGTLLRRGYAIPIGTSILAVARRR